MTEYKEDHRDPDADLELRKVIALEAIQIHLKVLFLPACIISAAMVGLALKLIVS